MAFIVAAGLLVLILVTELIQYIQISSLSRNTDEFEDKAFHDCHKWVTIAIDILWLASNIMLLFLGLRINNASLNCNLALVAMEEDSFHRKGSDRLKLIRVREQQ